MRSFDRWGPPDRVATMDLEGRSCGDEKFDQQITRVWDSLKPTQKNLRGVVSPEKCVKDKEDLDSLSENFEKKSSTATRLENCLMEGAGSYNWFGEEAEVAPSHRFDDVVNGTDFTLCFKRENGPSLKIAVDATTSPSSIELRKKIMRIADKLHEGNMPKVDYFYLDKEEEKGRVYLPRVIIGTDAAKAEKLFTGFRAMLDQKKELGPQVAQDNFQMELLKQIRRQLVFYLEDTLEAILRYHERESNSALAKIRMGLEKVKDMELAKEIESQEFKDLLDALDKNRQAIFELNPRLADNIYKHFDVLEITGQIVKEKSSQGIDMPGASNPTEEMLEIKKSAYA